MPPFIPDGAHVIDVPGYAERIGKVRHSYTLSDDELLIVASDRISTFDHVHPTAIPDKGKILTAMSVFWFRMAEKLGIPHHLITADTDKIIERYPALETHRSKIDGRSMLVQKADVAPVEAIVRGNITGSGWKDYEQNQGKVCGIQLPAGLQKSQELRPPIFTPSTKEDVGHDKNISFEQMVALVTRPIADEIRAKSLRLFTAARDYAKSCGIVLADTKFEFGKKDGEIILIDEILTPDSSRFWPEEQVVLGQDPPSFDKQYVRDYASKELQWNREPPAPALPDHVVQVTRHKYVRAYEMLTGLRLKL